MPGALGIAHDWNGRLQHAYEDAQQAVGVFGGDLYRDTEANQALLNILPRQILHISAHGQHRIDQPDFSYIQLADGPVYTDDLFQYDLRYELVMLSACETGRSQVNPTDELIGLGRGFLFAGAGALIASLWKVEEQITLEWMEAFYHDLATGASKAAALRHAALKLMHRYPRLHPAYWGAFQLIGSPAPLSTLSTIASPSTH
jgi:CHAT domain-containing protein